MIAEVRSGKDLLDFIYLPLHLHRRNPYWVPPVYLDAKKLFSPDKNKSFINCDTVRLLCIQNGKPAGRAMGIIHNGYNALKKEKTARFGWFECIDDQRAAHELLSYIEDWAGAKGMDKVIGPFGFSDKDPQGLLVEGFEHRAVLTTAYHPPYFKNLIESQGYTKEIDLVDYHIPVPETIPEFYRRIYDRAVLSQKAKIKEFTRKRELKPYIVPVLRLMNETFSAIYGSFPLSEPEMHALAKEYLPVLDPDFVKIVTNEAQEPVAFIIAMPDVSEGLKKAGGKLLPFGIFYIMKAARKTDKLVLLLGGIRSDYQGKGLDAMMGIKMLESASRRNFRIIDSHLELESNVKVRAEMEKMGGKVCKTYRIYRKSLV
jgi:hypothetical protein